MPDLTNTVKALYVAFARGDIATILEMATDDVSWEYEGPAELPTSGIRRSPKGVAEFFSAAAGQSSDLKLEMTEFFSTDDAVAAFGRCQVTIKATGIRVDTPLAHYFKFRGGKISRFVQLSNTGAMAEAIRGRARSQSSADTACVSENKTLVTEYFRALTGQVKPPALVAKYVADEALAKHIADSEAAFPKYELLPEEIIGEGELVVVRAEFRGVHQGPFAGIEPTGKSVSAGLIIIYKVQNRKIVNHWMQFDMFSLLQQLDETRGSVPEQQNAALVQKQLEAFGRTDINTLIDNCTSDCEIYSPGPEIIPYSGTKKGHAEIRAYFESLIGTQSNANLSVDQFLVQGNTVAVMGRYSAQVKSTGKAIDTPVTLSFEIRGEKISRYTALADTAAVAAGYARTVAAAS